jgi:hypothetical protein
MNGDSDSNIRRSTRINSKRGYKINYKEIEDGKDFSEDNDSFDQVAREDFKEKVMNKISAKPTKASKSDVKLSHPKKSLTAYTLFVKIKRQELQEKNPSATTPELMKEIGRLWKSISEKEKSWYQKMAAKDKERYKKEMDRMQKLKEKHKMSDCELKRPKKCLSSYMIFVREVRAKVTEEYPDMNALDVMKEVGRRWQSISAEDKNYYQALAEKDKERFKRENQQYMKELEQLDNKLKQINPSGEDELVGEPNPDNASGKSNENSKYSVGANGKRMRRDPNMPKKPLSAYIYFSQEKREEIKKKNPKMPVATIMKEVSNQWSAMSKAERAPYVNAAKEDKERYEKELSKTKKQKVADNENSKGTLEQDMNYVYDVDQEAEDNKKTKKSKTDESWGDQQLKTSQPLPKEPITVDAKDVPQPQKLPEMVQPKPRSPQESQFRFNLPESKHFNYASTSPIPVRKDFNTFGGGTNYNYQDTNSGSTDYNQQNPYMYRPSMFSPAPFNQNRSPGVSPNMMPMYSPMMMRGNDSYKDYSNRNPQNLSRSPTVMGQTAPMSGNKNDAPYNEYNQYAPSPSGFTPMRTPFQKNNPMFSPTQNFEGAGLFGPSPGAGGMSYQNFGSYGRTPVNQYNTQRFMPRPNNPPQNQGQDSSRAKNGGGLFDLNPFGTS